MLLALQQVVATHERVRDNVAHVELTTRVRGTAFQLLAVLLLCLVTVVWSSGRGLLARLTSERTLSGRVDPALGLALAGALGLAIVVGPVPAPPGAGFVAVRDDRNSLDEPHYFIPLPRTRRRASRCR